MTRYYRIVHKDTKQVLDKLIYVITRAPITGKYVPHWVDPKTDSSYKCITAVNYIINSMISHQLMSVLDECELITMERKFVPVNGSIKLETIRNRLEQKALVHKLTNNY